MITMVFLIAACGSSTERSTARPDSGWVTGTVSAGPSCPVERPGVTCERRTLVLTVTARRGDGAVAGDVATDVAGHYSMRLAVGVYSVTAGSGSTLPRCESRPITVRSAATVNEDIRCDTGIR